MFRVIIHKNLLNGHEQATFLLFPKNLVYLEDDCFRRSRLKNKSHLMFQDRIIVNIIQISIILKHISRFVEILCKLYVAYKIIVFAV